MEKDGGHSDERKGERKTLTDRDKNKIMDNDRKKQAE